MANHPTEESLQVLKEMSADKSVSPHVPREGIMGKNSNGSWYNMSVDTDGKVNVNATVNATITGSAIEDGVSSSIKATVKDLTNSNPLTTAIVDANGDQITSFGGGTQYTEGDTDASITGTAVMWEDTSDTLRAVSHAKPLPVHVTTAENGVVSTVNSSTATLTANSTFTGTSEEVLDVSTIIVNVKASHASATDGLVIEFSPDGTNWDNSDKYTIPAATGKTFTAQPAGRYMRVRYTNGGTNQTYFRLETILKYVATKSSSHRIQDTLSDDDDGELGISVIKLRTAQDNYVSGAATNGGNFKVSIEEVNGTTDFATETTLAALLTELLVMNGGMAMQVDDTGTTLYQGWAEPGTATSASGWRIRRVVSSGTPTDTSITFADGNRNFDNVWDSRTGLTYS